AGGGGEDRAPEGPPRPCRASPFPADMPPPSFTPRRTRRVWREGGAEGAGGEEETAAFFLSSCICGMKSINKPASTIQNAPEHHYNYFDLLNKYDISVSIVPITAHAIARGS